MGVPCLIIGKSGSGKSTSLRNFPECGVVNVLGKPLPFKSKNHKVKDTDSYDMVKAILKKSTAKSIAVDDSGYLMTNQFMRGHSSQGAGSAIFSFYNDIGDSYWKLIRLVVEELPADKIVYFMMHEDKNEFGDIKPKTIGKILDERVCLEGMFTIVLHSQYEDGRYTFRTKTTGFDVTKTPFGMFDEEFIDNDLKKVDDVIREYWNLGEKSG